MAQTKFYFNKGEWAELFKFIEMTGGRVIPDIFYESDQYVVLSNFEEFMEYQEHRSVHFFLTNDRFTVQPIMVTLNKYTSPPKCHIYQRKGGPYIDISCYRGFAEDSDIPHSASYLEYYPRFIDYYSSFELRASDELKEYYNELVKFVKANCKSVKKNGRKHLIGNKTLSEIHSLI